MEYRIGQVVRSIAGRDNGKAFIVVRTEGDYVYIADGETRRLEAPKKVITYRNKSRQVLRAKQQRITCCGGF